MPALIIPAPDPIPLPAPTWLLTSLLVLTFFLHLIPMNVTLGGTLIAAVAEFRARHRGSPGHERLARQLGHLLPVTMAFTITLGVAPLLFLQVLYGQFFYTSSILMAWPWLAAVGLMVLGYIGLYLFSLRPGPVARWGTPVALLAGLCFLAVAFLYTNNLVLMLTPARWPALYEGGRSGLHLNLEEATVLPRALHFTLAALAVSGLAVVVLGLRALGRGEGAYGRWVLRQGIGWFAFPTGLQFLVGPWFLLTLPPAVHLRFLGGSARETATLGAAILLALASLVLLLLASGSSRPKLPAIAGLVGVGVTMALMVLIRHWVRAAYLARVYQVDALPVRAQTPVIVLFGLLLILALVLIAWMLRPVVGGRRDGP